MSVSSASVHPVEAPPPAAAPEATQAPRVRMEDIQGMPATLLGLTLRFFQFFFAAASLSVMASTNDFPSVSAFWYFIQFYSTYNCFAVTPFQRKCMLVSTYVSYLVAATILQSLWSLALATVDVYAIMVKRSLQNRRLVSLFAIGDGVTSTMTFAAACASAGITVLIDNDLNSCSANHCVQFETSTALAFISWFAALPSFLFNFWSLASSSR
ncbi:hypothetical protein BRARA_G01371 [Brassica rapa]|uniref:CASP-like protein n=1 Tax=Brassica campestris TaxID=3711 RepID=A0A397YL33_BRACM|nr:hypothetical protein BRARA_G01371 [Brassica rapa]